MIPYLKPIKEIGSEFDIQSAKRTECRNNGGIRSSLAPIPQGPMTHDPSLYMLRLVVMFRAGETLNQGGGPSTASLKTDTTPDRSLRFLFKDIVLASLHRYFIGIINYMNRFGVKCKLNYCFT